MIRSSHRRAPAAQTYLLPGCLLLFAALCAAAPQWKPLFTIDEDTTAFSFGPGGRIAFAVQHVFSERKFDVERDDFWIADGGRGKRRILNGKDLTHGEGGFSYAVRSLRWSPGGTKLAAELTTGAQAERHGRESVSTQSFLLGVNGQEVKIADGDSFIPDTRKAAWLDESTVIYLEQVKPGKEFTIGLVRPAAGHPQRLFPDTYFLDAAWIVPARQAIAVASPSHGEKPRLVLLDLTGQTVRELASLDSFEPEIRISPSGRRVAFFRDPGTLEWRALADPQTPHDVQALFGLFYWTQDEQHVLLKSGPQRRSSVLESVRLADGSSDDLFGGLSVWHFVVTADGARMGVSPPGKHVISVYDLPPMR